MPRTPSKDHTQQKDTAGRLVWYDKKTETPLFLCGRHEGSTSVDQAHPSCLNCQEKLREMAAKKVVEQPPVSNTERARREISAAAATGNGIAAIRADIQEIRELVDGATPAPTKPTGWDVPFQHKAVSLMNLRELIEVLEEFAGCEQDEAFESADDIITCLQPKAVVALKNFYKGVAGL